MDYIAWHYQWIFLGLLVIFLKDVHSHPQQRYQENYIEEDKFLPNFITLGQKYSIALGSTVVLPCKLNETEHSSQYVLAWKRNIAVLTAGSVKVTVNPRIRLIPPEELQNNLPHTSSYNLEIRDVRLSDAGEYVCQIGSMEPKEISHTLIVLVPPRINTIQPSTRVDVSKGASIRLECQATGNPPPKIIWSRKNNVMPNGEPNITNSVLEVMYADRHTVGQYRCTADNRVGQPDTKDIAVNVLYSPEIEIEQPFIHTGVGFEAKLTCIVHAEPMPHVIWYKDSTQLGITEQISQQNHGNRYSLIIRNVTYIDLGNYTCQASNNLGKDRASLTLSAIPTICVFDSPTLSNYRDQYNISWTVQSHSSIREYRLFYRKEINPRNHNHRQQSSDDKLDNHIGAHFYTGSSGSSSSSSSSSSITTWGNNGIGSSSSSSGNSASNINSGTGITSSTIGGNNLMGVTGNGINSGTNNNNGGGGIHSEHTKWKNIIIPEVYPSFNEIAGNGIGYPYGSINGMSGGSNGIGIGYTPDHNGIHRNQNIRHKMSYLIRNLAPATNYEARVQARNDHDWNKLSAVFYFSTRAEDLELEPSAQPAVSKTAGVLDKDFSNGSVKLSNNSIQPILSIILLVIIFLCL